jgi:hypothetical protein
MQAVRTARRAAIARIAAVSVIAVMALGIGAQAATADPYGDWNTQYQTTYSWAKSHYYCPSPGCSFFYYSSVPYNPSSRVFIYGYAYANGQQCYSHVYIGSNNYIWNSEYYCV